MRDRPSRFEESYLRAVGRIDIPLRSVVNLRRVAEELRGLAQRLDFLSRDPGDTAEVLYEASKAVRHTRHNIEKIRSPGRPKKRVNSLRWVRDKDHNI
jgi:hypothetical protein